MKAGRIIRLSELVFVRFTDTPAVCQQATDGADNADVVDNSGGFYVWRTVPELDARNRGGQNDACAIPTAEAREIGEALTAEELRGMELPAATVPPRNDENSASASRSATTSETRKAAAQEAKLGKDLKDRASPKFSTVPEYLLEVMDTIDAFADWEVREPAHRLRVFRHAAGAGSQAAMLVRDFAADHPDYFRDDSDHDGWQEFGRYCLGELGGDMEEEDEEARDKWRQLSGDQLKMTGWEDLDRYVFRTKSLRLLLKMRKIELSPYIVMAEFKRGLVPELTEEIDKDKDKPRTLDECVATARRHAKARLKRLKKTMLPAEGDYRRIVIGILSGDAGKHTEEQLWIRAGGKDQWDWNQRSKGKDGKGKGKWGKGKDGKDGRKGSPTADRKGDAKGKGKEKGKKGKDRQDPRNAPCVVVPESSNVSCGRCWGKHTGLCPNHSRSKEDVQSLINSGVACWKCGGLGHKEGDHKAAERKQRVLGFDEQGDDGVQDIDNILDGGAVDRGKAVCFAPPDEMGGPEGATGEDAAAAMDELLDLGAVEQGAVGRSTWTWAPWDGAPWNGDRKTNGGDAAMVFVDPGSESIPRGGVQITDSIQSVLHDTCGGRNLLDKDMYAACRRRGGDLPADRKTIGDPEPLARPVELFGLNAREPVRVTQGAWVEMKFMGVDRFIFFLIVSLTGFQILLGWPTLQDWQFRPVYDELPGGQSMVWGIEYAALEVTTPAGLLEDRAAMRMQRDDVLRCGALMCERHLSNKSEAWALTGETEQDVIFASSARAAKAAYKDDWEGLQKWFDQERKRRSRYRHIDPDSQEYTDLMVATVKQRYANATGIDK